MSEGNILIDRKHDIIVNDLRYGYRLSPKITVRGADAPAGTSLQIGHVMDKWECSHSAAKRDVAELRRRGLITFVGSPQAGSYRRVWQ